MRHVGCQATTLGAHADFVESAQLLELLDEPLEPQ